MNSGSLLLEGEDIKGLNLPFVRASFGLVSQVFYTIYGNVTSFELSPGILLTYLYFLKPEHEDLNAVRCLFLDVTTDYFKKPGKVDLDHLFHVTEVSLDD